MTARIPLTLRNGTELAVWLAGNAGPAHVWLHGLGSHHQFWQHNWPALPGRHILLDLPGFGQSAPLPNEAAYAPAARLVAILEVVVEALALLQVPDAVWIGHSMGGQLALLAALRYPYRVQRLVLTAPAGIEPYTTQQVRTIDELARSGNMGLQTLRLLTMHLRAGRTSRTLAPAMDPRAPNGAYGRRLLWGMQAMVHQPVLPWLGQVRQPTLLLMGTNDGLIPNRWFHQLTPAEVAEAATAQMPLARLALVPGAGHFLPWEQPQDWNRIVGAEFSTALTSPSI